jgi:hypothetical protein
MDILGILCDIITNELGIDASRVVIYDQNWTPPSDSDLYVIVSKRQGQVLGSSNKFDSATNEEVKTVVKFDNFDIDLTSKNEDALDYVEDVIMSLKSQYSLGLQELNNIKIFRAGKILDLSFIEGASALKRSRIPVRISYVKEKRTSVDIYEHFKEDTLKVI